MQCGKRASENRLKEVRALALAKMAEWGLRPPAWVFRFDRARRRLGQCRFPSVGRPGVISVSAYHALLNPHGEVVNTVLHEIAHALVGPEHGHGEVWKEKAREVGARPERCGNIRTPVAAPWAFVCPAPCGTEHKKFRRPKHNLFICRKCRTQFSYRRACA
jgi:hypothetical protein